MDIEQVRADLAAIEQDASLADQMHLAGRIHALTQLEFIDEWLHWHAPPAERAALARAVDRERARLEQINAQLFQHARARFHDAVGRVSTPAATAARRELRAWLDTFTSYRIQGPRPLHTGYDALDALVDGALNLNEIPAPTQRPELEMIHLEPTPLRVVLEMVDRIAWQPEDVFYDVGSGLGQVPILVHLLTGVRAVGIEVEPAYCRVARASAERLGLSDVSTMQADAREADYTRGTVLYLFTPFVGEMLEAVLERLRSHTRGRGTAVCSFGPCSAHLAQQPWLRCECPDPEHEFKLAVFRSVA